MNKRAILMETAHENGFPELVKEQAHKETLHFITCGILHNSKSLLIGRLLLQKLFSSYLRITHPL